MKKFLLIIAMLFSTSLYAETHKVLSCNEDLSVCVENGVIIKDNGIVSEDYKAIYTQTCVVNDIKGKEIYRCETRKGLPKYEPKEDKKPDVVVKKADVKKNSIIFQAGVGPTGMEYVTNGDDSITVKTKYGPTGGATYLRRLDENYNVSGTVLLNRTGLVGVGVDF